MPRFLFGPVTRDFADRYLADARAAGECLAFGPDADLPIILDDTWAAVESRFPPGWRPDFVVAWLQYATFLPAILDTPVPLLGLAGDWTLLWHSYRHLLPLCDAVLVDEPGVTAFHKAGIDHAYYVNQYGLTREFLDEWDTPDGERDIDLLFVGNVRQSVQRERTPWLARLARLSDRYRVVIRTRVYGAEYRGLLWRAKAVFNRSIRGECNMRAFEAPACGAVLLQEAENESIKRYLTPGEEYVPYTDADFEATVARVLADDAGRRRIAAAGRARVRGYSFEALLRPGVGRALADRTVVESRLSARLRARPRPSLTGRVWGALGAMDLRDTRLTGDLAAAGRHELALVIKNPADALPLLDSAASINRVAALTRAAVLHALGRTVESAAAAVAVLAALAAESALSAEEAATPPHPGGDAFDLMRVEWERAGVVNAGDSAAEAAAKHALLRFRAHFLLALATNSLRDYQAAADLRPDLSWARQAFGTALAGAGRLTEAMPHLRAGAEGLPFDDAPARAYHQALIGLGEFAAADAIVAARRRLSAAAPGIVPAQPWFTSPAPPRPPTRVERQSREAFASRFGAPDTAPALCRFTPPDDTHVILALVAALRPTRVLEIGTADGAMTANLTAWTPPGAVVYSLGLIGAPVSGGAGGQAREVPNRYGFAFHADHFGRADKAFFVTADSRAYDFARFGPLDFAFLDGGHDLDTVLSDSRKAYSALQPGGCLVWHDYDAPVEWVKVREAIRRIGFAEPVYHVTGTRVAYLFKAGAAPALPPSENGAAASIPAVPRAAMRVALTMIVRNEERNLPAVLGPVRRHFHDVVVVDTGSEDRTRAVAAEHGARVVEFPWVDSFAAARNTALEHARGEYAFWLDADDRVDESNRTKLATLFAGLTDEHAAFVMKCRCLPDRPGGAITVVDHLRLFRLRPDVRWAYRVHEQVLPALRRTGADVRWADAMIDHVGYTDPVLRRRKLERDLRLLGLELADTPGEPFVQFNLGSVYQELGRPADALAALEASLRRSHPKDSITRKLYARIAGCHRALGNRAAARAVIAEGRRHYPADAELLFLDGLLRRDDRDLAGAAQVFEELIRGQDAPHFASVDSELRGTKARHNLADVYRELGQRAEAEAVWKEALMADPTLGAAREGLGELYLGNENWPALESLASEWSRLGPVGEVGATALRARACVARRDAGRAHAILKAGLERFPDARVLRVLMNHLSESQAISESPTLS
jgi:tetratricopeptide (TPR) repeat protein/predicted O-methyltransferase YrrM